jgi:uncharacterized membrane protein
MVKSYAYSQAELIYNDAVDRTGAQPNPRECLAESQRLMKGHKMDLFALQLSFLGWLFLSVLSLGILNLWLTPYINMSHVVFYENISKGIYLGKIDKTAERTSPDPQLDPHEEIGKDPDDFRDFHDF